MTYEGTTAQLGFPPIERPVFNSVLKLSFGDQQIKDWAASFAITFPTNRRRRAIADGKKATSPTDISDDVFDELLRWGEGTSG